MVGGVEVDVDVSFSVAVWSGGGVVVVVTESAASMLWCFGFWANFWAEETLLELFRFENVYNGCCMVDLIDDMNDVLFDLVFNDVAAAAVAVLVDVGFFLSDVDDDDEDELDLSMSLLSSVTAMLSPDESVWWWLWWLNKFWMSLEPDDKRLVFDEDDDAVIVW